MQSPDRRQTSPASRYTAGTRQPVPAAAASPTAPPASRDWREPVRPQPIVRQQSPDAGGYGGSTINRVSPGPAPYAVRQQQPSQPSYVSQAQYAEPAQDPLSNDTEPPSGGYTPRDFGTLPDGSAPGAPGGNFMGGPEPILPNQPRLPVDIVASEAQTGRFMLGAGVNSNAGLIGSIILDEQNFDWRRWPTSWEDFRSGRGLPRSRAKVPHRSRAGYRRAALLVQLYRAVSVGHAGQLRVVGLLLQSFLPELDGTANRRPRHAGLPDHARLFRQPGFAGRRRRASATRAPQDIPNIDGRCWDTRRCLAHADRWPTTRATARFCPPKATTSRPRGNTSWGRSSTPGSR